MSTVNKKTADAGQAAALPEAKKLQTNIDVFALANMAKLLGFAAEAHRTLSEIQDARRMCEATDKAIRSWVTSPEEWSESIPEFGSIGTYLCDKLFDLHSAHSEWGVEVRND